MSNVLLVYPKWHGLSKERYLPHSVLTIASILRERHEVKIRDLRVMDFDNKYLKWSDYVCLSVTTPQIAEALVISKKAKDSGLKTVWGGVHPTLESEQTVSNQFIDFVIRGQGEQTLLKLIDSLEKNIYFGRIDGLSWKKNNEIIHNRDKEPIPLKKIPDPAFDLINLKDYLNKDPNLGDRVIDVNSSRGCPHRCKFCYNTAFYKKVYWDGFPPERVLRQIELLKNECGITGFKFQDDEFFVNREWVAEICRGMIEKEFNLKWATSARIDYTYNWSDEFMSLIKKSGCARLSFGVESGSKRILDFIQKDIRLEQVLPVIEKCKRYGIVALCNFIIAFPTEEKDEVYQTWKLMNDIKRVDSKAITRAVNIFTPYPGTELYDLCKASGWDAPKTLEEWSSMDLHRNVHDYTWIPEDRRRFYKSLVLAMDASMNPSKLSIPFRFFTGIRLKTGFWSFPKELEILTKLGKAYVRRRY
jgi:radical SAM superfamily enzyme YgiQ (UPF0313 family)